MAVEALELDMKAVATGGTTVTVMEEIHHADERELEETDLHGIGHIDIDDVIEYVHTPTAKLPGYLDLYHRYSRQRWSVHDLDFSQDKLDWQRMSPESRESFLMIASGFHHGERQVQVELAPLFFGIPEEYKVFLSSHLEDEARHNVFFDTFYREVVGLPGNDMLEVLDGSYRWVQEVFVGPFGLLSYLTDDLRRDPYDRSKQMRYATCYMLWIEGVLALAVMKITLNYARDNHVLPAYYTGFTATCRDEARHVQGGMRFIRDLLDDDPTLVRDIHDTLRTLMFMSSARSGYVAYEPLGWTEERVSELFLDQMRRKLAMVGISLPQDLEDMIEQLKPTLAGG
jgi:ribonucleoside-diphosphate reductase beta chain